MSDALQFHGLHHARLPCPSPIPGAYSNSCLSRRGCHPTTSSSVIPFSCLQSCPVTGSFLMSQFFISVGQSIGGSISASILPMNIQFWFPLGWLDGSPCSPRDSQESCPTPQFKTINSSLLTILYSATVTSIHDIHPVGHFTWCTLHISYISKVTIYSLYILLSRIGTSQLCHVQFWLLLLDLHTNFSEGR